MNCIYVATKTKQKAGMAVSALTMLTLFILTTGAALPLQAQTELASPQVPSVTHNSWSSGAPIPTAIWAPAGVGVLKGEIYVVGGVNSAGTTIADTQIYNPATNTWSSGVSLPTPLSFGSGAVVKNVLYIMATGTNAVWAYNPKTKTWIGKTAMPTARSDAGIAVEKNIIYVAGGYNSGPLATVESYNPATDTWAEEAPLVEAKSDPSVGIVGTTIVTADGWDGNDNGYTEGYNATTNSWKALTADPTPRNVTCTGSISGSLYVAGGANGSTGLTVTESFKKKWATLASMPQGALFIGSAVYKSKVGGVANSVLYCIGGISTFPGTAINNVQIYQP